MWVEIPPELIKFLFLFVFIFWYACGNRHTHTQIWVLQLFFIMLFFLSHLLKCVTTRGNCWMHECQHVFKSLNILISFCCWFDRRVEIYCGCSCIQNRSPNGNPQIRNCEEINWTSCFVKFDFVQEMTCFACNLVIAQQIFSWRFKHYIFWCLKHNILIGT